MKLKKFLLRYYPPGIILEYVRNNGEAETKSIDLLNLTEKYARFLTKYKYRGTCERYHPRGTFDPASEAVLSRRANPE